MKWAKRDYLTYIVIEVHIIGDHIDIRVEYTGLMNYFLQHITYTCWKDEQGNFVLMQLVKENVEAISKCKKEEKDNIRLMWNMGIYI